MEFSLTWWEKKRTGSSWLPLVWISRHISSLWQYNLLVIVLRFYVDVTPSSLLLLLSLYSFLTESLFPANASHKKGANRYKTFAFFQNIYSTIYPPFTFNIIENFPLFSSVPASWAHYALIIITNYYTLPLVLAVPQLLLQYEPKYIAFTTLLYTGYYMMSTFIVTDHNMWMWICGSHAGNVKLILCTPLTGIFTVACSFYPREST